MAVSTAFFCALMENDKNDIGKANPYAGEANPYAAPVVNELGETVHGGTSFVPQIRIVAIFMIVQSVLELIMAAMFVGMGVFMPWAMAQQPQQNQIPADEQWVIDIVFMGYGIAGAVLMVSGILRLIAGIMGVMYRGRTLGLVSHFLGLISVCTCYCLPTSVGICVWGSIVYLNEDVKRAFEMRSEGSTIAEVDAFFR